MRNESDLPCFENFEEKAFRERFKESATEIEVMNFAIHGYSTFYSRFMITLKNLSNRVMTIGEQINTTPIKN